MRMKSAKSRKLPANLTVDGALLAEARSLGISLSGVLEDGLRAKVAEAKQARWLAENAEAIEAHNERVSRKGCFGDKLRRF